MPNWTTVFISMEGIEKESELFYKNEDGELCFDFNSLIPEPKTYEEYVAGGGDKLDTPEEAHCQIDEDRPWFNWYDWHIENWGTKWNACHCEVCYDCVHFETAWSYPEPIIKALSEKYPDREIDVSYDYEGYNETYNETWLNGDRTFEEIYGCKRD